MCGVLGMHPSSSAALLGKHHLMVLPVLNLRSTCGLLELSERRTGLECLSNIASEGGDKDNVRAGMGKKIHAEGSKRLRAFHHGGDHHRRVCLFRPGDGCGLRRIYAPAS